MLDENYIDIPYRICKAIYPQAEYSREETNVLFSGFAEKYKCLSCYTGLNKLLDLFTAEKICLHLEEHFVEFNLAYDIVNNNPEINIEYEPEIRVNKNKYTPDFRFYIDNQLYYIQAKCLNPGLIRGCLKESMDNEYMVAIDSLPQMIKSLSKATKSQPNEPAIYLIVQYNNEHYFDKIGIGEALYGKEVYVRQYFDNGICKTRLERKPGEDTQGQGGFFYTPDGKGVNAYISAKTNTPFGNQVYTVFENPINKIEIDQVEKLFKIESVINKNTYIV